MGCPMLVQPINGVDHRRQRTTEAFPLHHYIVLSTVQIPDHSLDGREYRTMASVGSIVYWWKGDKEKNLPMVPRIITTCTTGTAGKIGREAGWLSASSEVESSVCSVLHSVVVATMQGFTLRTGHDPTLGSGVIYQCCRFPAPWLAIVLSPATRMEACDKECCREPVVALCWKWAHLPRKYVVSNPPLRRQVPSYRTWIIVTPVGFFSVSYPCSASRLQSPFPPPQIRQAKAGFRE
ncbi:hypothetical protein LY78DRAFT_291459 [Colletotrichum sublineola]|nr:hypothetical protein LY78DRAFT_291459 [Colletotrichum sublineola]